MKEVAGDWFTHFKTENFSLEDEPRKGCPKGIDSENIEAAIIVNPTTLTRELGEKFNICYMIVLHEF